MPTDENTAAEGRPRGRPRLTIDRDAVADAVAELFRERGYDGVSIVGTAAKLSVSRATLYRTVPTKQHLVGILFERSTREISEKVEKAIAEIADPADRLRQMVRLQADAAAQMGYAMPVFFGDSDLPKEVIHRWRRWSRRFENLWVSVVDANMRAGYLDEGDPLITTRLILGMILWVSRWHRPKGSITSSRIADEAIRLLRLGVSLPEEGRRNTAGRKRRSTPRSARSIGGIERACPPPHSAPGVPKNSSPGAGR